MDIKELMVGDFVTYTDEDGIVEAYMVVGTTNDFEVFLGDPKDPKDNFDVWDDRTKRVKPIEISEAFLLANGFHKSAIAYEPDTYIWHGNPDKLEHSASTVRVCFYDSCTFVNIENWASKFPVKMHRPYTPYVHQLQQACRMCNIDIDWKL